MINFSKSCTHVSRILTSEDTLSYERRSCFVWSFKIIKDEKVVRQSSVLKLFMVGISVQSGFEERRLPDTPRSYVQSRIVCKIADFEKSHFHGPEYLNEATTIRNHCDEYYIY